MIAVLILASTLGVPAPNDVRAERPPDTEAATAAADPEVDRARRAWALLKPAERKDVADFLASELEHVRTFQLDLARWVLANQDRDPLAWPARTAAAWFDPERHAPAQPIPRRSAEPDDPRVIAARKELGVPPDPRAWVYDWGSGSVLHDVANDTPERAFELAVRGLPPRADLVRALLECTLDDGSQRAAHAAFGHAYTDRAGLVYPGITLYDAWRSQAEIEMPDVDCLGLVHVLLDDWTTWTSIVPGNRQASLYARIGELFVPLPRHRELRTAIAATYLEARPELCCGYEGSLDNFHALWDVNASTPGALAPKLPDAAGWKEFLSSWVAECTRDGETYLRGAKRRETLAADGAAIRATLAHVLEEYGAFARLREATGPKTK